jgi:hypothetical protein
MPVPRLCAVNPGRDRAAEAGMTELREKPMFLEDLAELLDGS